jgi:GTP pyrophosphokinase
MPPKNSELDKYKKQLLKVIELLKEHNQKFSEKKIKNALEFAFNIHKNDFDKEKPFMDHLLKASALAAQSGLGEKSVLVALLHNTYSSSRHNIPERTENRKILEKKFGKDLADMIDNVLFAWEIENINRENKGEVIEKIMVNSATNPEIIILNLIFRLLQLEKSTKEDERKYLGKKALAIYAPLAHKLGVCSLKAKMEDKAFELLNPEKYEEINQLLEKYEIEIEKEIKSVIEILSKELEKRNVKAKIYSRRKNIYSIYEKMKRKSRPLPEIYDIGGIRIITNELKDCYEIVGIIHSLWTPISGEFDDYISKPKSNLYQSIHTAIIGPSGNPLEIQIRTGEMHDVAEYGVASHWAYKGHKKTDLDFKLLLMRQFLDWKEEMKLSYSPSFDFRLDEEKIFVLSPKGKIVELPKGSTPIDFAYGIHSELGQQCQKAKVNEKFVPLNYKLKNLDIVEIVTSPSQKPKLGWLSFVKSNKARNKLNRFFKIVLKKKRKSKSKTCMLVRETDPKIKLAGCCSPLPGDKIISIQTTKRKYSVHKEGCTQLEKIDKAKVVEVDWGQKILKNQLTEIVVTGKQSNELMIALLKKLNEVNMPLINAHAIDRENTLKIIFQIKAENLSHLEDALRKVREVPGVLSAARG